MNDLLNYYISRQQEIIKEYSERLKDIWLCDYQKQQALNSIASAEESIKLALSLKNKGV